MRNGTRSGNSRPSCHWSCHLARWRQCDGRDEQLGQRHARDYELRHFGSLGATEPEQALRSLWAGAGHNLLKPLVRSRVVALDAHEQNLTRRAGC